MTVAVVMRPSPHQWTTCDYTSEIGVRACVRVYSLRLGQRAEGPTEAPPYKGQVSSVEAVAREISLGIGRRAGGPRGLLEIGGVIVRAQRGNERWESWRRREEKTCEMNGEAYGREKQTGEREGG